MWHARGHTQHLLVALPGHERVLGQLVEHAVEGVGSPRNQGRQRHRCRPRDVQFPACAAFAQLFRNLLGQAGALVGRVEVVALTLLVLTLNDNLEAFVAGSLEFVEGLLVLVVLVADQDGDTMQAVGFLE